MNKIFTIIFYLFFAFNIKAQVSANAGKDQSICVYDSLHRVATGLSAGDTGSYQWTDLSTGSVTYSQTLSRKNLTSGFRTFELTVRKTHNGNTYIAKDSFTLTVYGLPLIKLKTTDTICSTTKPFLLNSIVPGAWLGIWSGPGVNNNQLDPSFAPNNKMFEGPYVLKFSYTHPLTYCTSSDSEKIYIQNAPKVSFTNSNPYHVCDGQVLQLGIMQNYATSATWSTTGDGVFKNISGLKRDYLHGTKDTSNGQITIAIMSNPTGVCAAGKDTLMVLFEKTPKFAMPSHFVVCEPGIVNFASYVYTPTKANNLRYSWWFGNGDSLINTSNGSPQGIQYTEAKVGWYDVRLKVSYQWGINQNDYCSTQVDSLDYVRVLPMPKADFTSTPEFLATVSHPEFEFKNNSTIRNGWEISYYQWLFSKTIVDDTSTLKNPIHQYPADTAIHKALLVAYYQYYDYSQNVHFFCKDSVSSDRKIGPDNSTEIRIMTLTQNSKIRLQLPFKGNFQVLDVNGKIKENYPNNNTQQTVDISQWPAGIYLFFLEDGSRKVTVPFVKY